MPTRGARSAGGRWGWGWHALAGLILLLLWAAGAAGQEGFKVAWNAERLDTGRTRVTGTVTNEGRVDVLDVYVTAEALDDKKKVVARGIAFAGSIPQRGTAPFTVNVPAPATATSFRVSVSSFRSGFGAQGP